MSDAEPEVAPRKWPKLKICLGLLLFFIAWFLYQLFGPNPQITVSKETTYITEPLGLDGLPDFPAYLLERDSKGVTPENNAAVLIWQATWPGDLDPQDQTLLAEALGMESVPSEEDSLVEVDSDSVLEKVGAELTKHFSADLADEETGPSLSTQWQEWLRDDLAKEAIYEARTRPWTPEQMPALAEWVVANQKPLDMLVEAAARPEYFSPSPSFLGDKDDSLVEMALPHAEGMRSVVRALLTRGMWHIGAGRTSEAWTDIHTCLRLSRHVSKEKFLVNQLVSHAIDKVAFQSTQSLLQHKDLNNDLAENILADLLQLPSVSAAEVVDQGERLVHIDNILRMAQGKYGEKEKKDLFGKASTAIIKTGLDWNHFLREGNKWHDRLVKSMRMPKFDERRKQLAEIDSEITQLDSPATSLWSALGFMVSRKSRTQAISNVFIDLLLSTMKMLQVAADRTITQRHLTQLAVALALHRLQHGNHPESLEELVPAILPKLPLELYTEKPFVYQRKDDGGSDMTGKIVNGEWTDETPEERDHDSSDLVIRVPQPEFKLPELPLDELVP